MKKPGITSTLAAITLAATFGANAALIKDAVTVDARGLNLQSNEGQEVLYQRLTTAAEQICGATNLRKAGSLAQAIENRNCVKETLSKAVDSVGNEGLTEIHKTS